MLIDWITASISVLQLPPDVTQKLGRQGSRLLKVDAATGEVKWDIKSFSRLPSSTEDISFRLSTYELTIAGSPARCEGNGCNVFGGPIAQSLDIMQCLAAMIRRMRACLQIALPDAECWNVTRVDITGNVLLGDLRAVLRALDLLSYARTGRQKPFPVGSTIYWNRGSNLRSGKVYAKGPQLRKAEKGNESKRNHTEAHFNMADRLLRLELKLGSKFFKRNGSWKTFTREALIAQWNGYFRPLFGTEMITNTDDMLEKLIAVASSEEAADAAYNTWLRIRERGFDQAKTECSKSTWNRHIALLRKVGLCSSDLYTGKVTELPRASVLFTVANDWADIRMAS